MQRLTNTADFLQPGEDDEPPLEYVQPWQLGILQHQTIPTTVNATGCEDFGTQHQPLLSYFAELGSSESGKVQISGPPFPVLDAGASYAWDTFSSSVRDGEAQSLDLMSSQPTFNTFDSLNEPLFTAEPRSSLTAETENWDIVPIFSNVPTNNSTFIPYEPLQNFTGYELSQASNVILGHDAQNTSKHTTPTNHIPVNARLSISSITEFPLSGTHTSSAIEELDINSNSQRGTQGAKNLHSLKKRSSIRTDRANKAKVNHLRENNHSGSSRPSVYRNHVPKSLAHVNKGAHFGVIGERKIKRKQYTAEERKRVNDRRESGACMPCHLAGKKCITTDTEVCARCKRVLHNWQFCISYQDRLPTLVFKFRLKKVPDNFGLTDVKLRPYYGHHEYNDLWAPVRKDSVHCAHGWLNFTSEMSPTARFDHKFSKGPLRLSNKVPDAAFTHRVESWVDTNYFSIALTPYLDSPGKKLYRLAENYLAKNYEGYDLVWYGLSLFSQISFAIASCSRRILCERTEITEFSEDENFHPFLYHIYKSEVIANRLFELLSKTITSAKSKKDMWAPVALTIALMFYPWQSLLNISTWNSTPVQIQIESSKDIIERLNAVFKLAFSGMKPLDQGYDYDSESFQLTSKGLREFKNELASLPSMEAVSKLIILQLFMEDFTVPLPSKQPLKVRELVGYYWSILRK